jgi:hypothetical protein
MMVGLYAPDTGERGSLSRIWHRLSRLLSAALLSVLVVVAIAAAPAAADPIGGVRINGIGALPCGGAADTTGNYCVGSAPLVTVTLAQFPGGNPDERLLKVRNDETDGSDAITQLTASIDPASSNGFRAGFYWEGPAPPTDATTYRCGGEGTPEMRCPFATGVGRGHDFDLEYVLKRDYSSGLQNLDVEFNYGKAISPCAGPAAPFPGQARDTARAADACTPPSHTKITEAKINRNTAFFRFTGRHASSFECELLRNKKVMFRHSCNSPKPYANPLPRGNYVFIVTGVNRAGTDHVSAVKKFTVR